MCSVRFFQRYRAFRLVLAAVLLILLANSAVFAQQSLISGGFFPDGPSVDTYWKTRLLFKDDADAFMDPNDYQLVRFDVFYAETQGAVFSQQYTGTNYLAGGAAVRFDSLYTALFFDGSGDNFLFGGHNSLYILVGTPSWGAFKPFYRTFSDESLFGISWGINFEADGLLVKPEVMAGYAGDRDSSNGWKGYVNAGASVDVEFAADSGESSMDVQYEIKAGVPTQNQGDFMEHYFEALYRRLYGVTDGVQLGWFAGAAAEYIKHERYTRTYYERWGLTPMGGVGFRAALGDLFSLNGQVFAAYNMNYEGINITPVAGGAFTFTPFTGLKIELSTSPANGLDNFSLWNVSLMASFRK
jgi:hypothetical protein